MEILLPLGVNDTRPIRHLAQAAFAGDPPARNHEVVGLASVDRGDHGSTPRRRHQTVAETDPGRGLAVVRDGNDRSHRLDQTRPLRRRPVGLGEGGGRGRAQRGRENKQRKRTHLHRSLLAKILFSGLRMFLSSS